MRAAAVISTVLCVAALAACGVEEEPSTTAATPTSTVATDPDPPEAEPAPAPDGERAATPAQEGPPAERERPLGVEGVTAAVLTRSGSPQQGCEELVTERFVRAAYGDTAGCLAARRQGGLAARVEVERVRESAAAATAVAIPDGGPYDGVEVEVELVRDPAEGRGWRVDSLLADVPAGP